MVTTGILTPDQRLRVFVSSTLTELAGERAAARRAIEQLRLVPVMFELGARPYPPRSLYLAYLRQSHVFVGIYGERYGWTAPDMEVSGLEDEVRHAGDLPMLLYLKTPAPGRDRRLAAMLDDVAQHGGVSYKTYSSAAELESLLATDLAVLLTERFTERSELPVSVPLPRPASEFVGRGAELGELVELITSDAVRLVTLTGPGGIGKTRLAIEVAHAVADRFPDGAVFVPLATRTADDFLEAIGTAVGLRDLGQQPVAQSLVRCLGDRHGLLVLDNFEHLLPAAGEVADLLEQTRSPCLLVTSRTALRLSGEEEFPVGPLGLSRITHRVEDVARAEATQLFVRRVAAVRHGYRLTERDAATVAMICRRLDGLPLALELVAARANVLTIDELAARLDRVLDLSSPAQDVPVRQRTLRQTMDWSYDQLPPVAQDLFAQLGVFAGSFALDAAEALCAVEEGVELLDVLAVLVDHSLLQPHLDTGTARFSMLEIVRAYARSRLEPSTAERVSAAHAAYYRDVAIALEAVQGSGKRDTIARLDLEVEDIATALDWLAEHDRRADVAEMCWSMWSYHWLRGALAQGRRWTRGALAADGSLSARPRARLLASDGFLAFLQRDYDTAGRELLEALEIAKREGDDDVSLRASILLPLVFGGTGEEERARSLAKQGLRLARTRHDRWAEVMALTGLCWLNAAFGHFAGEEETFDQALAVARDVNDPLLLAMALNHMADLRMWQGRHHEAATLLAESVALFGDLRMLTAGSACLHAIAVLLARLDRWALAVQLQAASDAAMQSIETGLWSPWLPRRKRLLTDARQSLGDVQFDHALATGQAWTFDDAVGAASTALAQVADTAVIQPPG